MNMTATFDTLLYAKKLREAGCPELQAEIQAEALKDILDNNFATKHDIEQLRVATKQDIEQLRIETKQDIGQLRVETKQEAVSIRNEMEKLEYRLTAKLGSLIVIVAGGLAALIKF